ncbi:translation initiation factor eIF-2B subunit alpha isoform X2 [Amborella trichopoda]|uniref:translation initiation factor eIF-2B subunit alpha isoform X2 n=1 Tax=Amborella trichopoda TaxID=13333 RepID=UPI0005D44949|nr:translation initiation factor eIF-2B subunit alpha isoform X2 [Amborella trichopoda]|eukprot:XP_011628548.1 translation initiation factor eIF-2B subunit alpha isoform X2 [Amborella trichopoda]
MLRPSASFILDQRESLSSPPPNLAPPATMAPKPPIQAGSGAGYYAARAEHHAVSSHWLAQAQAAVDGGPAKPGLSESHGDRHRDRENASFSVIDEFNFWRKKPDLAEAVAAIMALAAVIRTSEATTMMELEIELKKASDTLKSWDTTSISLSAGCDLFMRHVTRTSALEYEDFDAAKARLIERGERFGEISLRARKTIAMLSQDFIFDGCTILVHGFSRVVLEVLRLAASSGKLFRVFCTDGVVESGGIINMMGTYQIALVAHSMNKPVYVAAESYKFARLYPLDQKDLAPALRSVDFGVPVPTAVEVETSARDYTPPQYLTLLFTDLGVLTPSVVSDELIQLYL